MSFQSAARAALGPEHTPAASVPSTLPTMHYLDDGVSILFLVVYTNLRSHRPKQDTLSRLLCQRRGESSSKALFSSIYATAGYSLVGLLQNFPGHSWSPIANYEQLRPLGKLHYATGFKKCHSGSYPYTSSPIAVFPPCQNCCSKT